MSDEKRMDTALLAENDENTAAEENALVMKLDKPFTFEGQTYTEVDLSGLEDTTAADLQAVGRFVTKKIPLGTRIKQSFVTFVTAFAERKRYCAVGIFLLDYLHNIAHNIIGKISVLSALQNKGAKTERVACIAALQNLLF